MKKLIAIVLALTCMSAFTATAKTCLECLQDGNKCFQSTDACSSYQGKDGETLTGCKPGSKAQDACDNKINYKTKANKDADQNINEVNCPQYKLWACEAASDGSCVKKGNGSDAACPGSTYNECK